MHRFTTCLDSGKSGLCVNTDRFREDQGTWDYPLPDCMKKGKDYVENRRPLPPFSNQFVLDVLMRKGKEIGDQHLKKYKEKRKEGYFGEVDPDLVAPITRALDQIGHQNQAVHCELMKLVEHVEKVRHGWRTYWSSKPNQQSMVWGKAKKSAKKLADDQRIEKLREDFASSPGPDEIGILLALDPYLVSKLKASIAISVNQRPSEAFAFSMAYETLLKIKAEASGGVSPITHSFGDILGVSPAIGRFYSQ